MILEICNSNLLFKINNIEFIGILCIFLISFFLTIMFLIKNKIILKKYVFKFINNKLVLIMVAVLFSFAIFILVIEVFVPPKFEGCYCPTLELKRNDNVLLKKVQKNKVIIVGDSRMSLINDNKNQYIIPKNYSFIALSGAKIKWFTTVAIDDLENVLKLKNKKNIYHVVINMGVNDMNKVVDPYVKADQYFTYYKKLALKHPDVHFYLLSINPIEKNLMRKYWPNMIINNSDIEKYNKKIQKNIKMSRGIITYCDSYSNLIFNTYDGLHYTEKTSQDILDYIIQDCINYK
ncbi:MAG: hypothetical protein IJ093_03775 [Bacilli bacterium]|nr:hypothetical protein [Bacilli bacterium]